MILTQKQINDVYPLLKGLKLSSVENEELVSTWKILKLLRPIFQEYQSSIEDFSKTLQDEKFASMQVRLQKAQEREQKVKNGEYSMTPEDIKDVEEINLYFAEVNAKGQEYLNSLEEKEFDLPLEKLSMQGLVSALKASDIKFEDLEKIDFIFE